MRSLAEARAATAGGAGQWWGWGDGVRRGAGAAHVAPAGRDPPHSHGTGNTGTTWRQSAALCIPVCSGQPLTSWVLMVHSLNLDGVKYQGAPRSVRIVLLQVEEELLRRQQFDNLE